VTRRELLAECAACTLFIAALLLSAWAYSAAYFGAAA
jgi:hypothetical protein